MMRMCSTKLCWSKVKSSKVFENLRITLQPCKRVSKHGSDTVAQIESDIQLAQTRLTDLKAVISTKEAELAALEQAAAK